jgi:hypothetical protein
LKKETKRERERKRGRVRGKKIKKTLNDEGFSRGDINVIVVFLYIFLNLLLL